MVNLAVFLLQGVGCAAEGSGGFMFWSVYGVVRRVVGGCGGAARGASCCAGDDLPEGMIWLRHELQLGLHELRCGAWGGVVGVQMIF